MEQFFEFHENSNSEVVLKSIAYGNIEVQKVRVLKLWPVNANSVDIMSTLSWGPHWYFQG